MLTAISAILGAITAFAPALLNFFTVKANNAQQLELRKLDLQATRESKTFDVVLADRATDAEQLKSIYNFANAPTGIKLVDAITVMVRPYITIVLFHMWGAIEIALLYYGLQKDYDLDKLAALVWDDSAKQMLAAVVGFWFGSRMLTRSQPMAIPYLSNPPVVPASGARPSPASSATPSPTRTAPQAHDHAGGPGTG